MIEVKSLTFEYPGKRALDNISFRIEPKTITALVGPNGAGKTTLLRCIAALEEPLAGSIHVNELDVLAEPREAHRLMGYLPDLFGLYEELTVEKSLTYFAMVQGITGVAQIERIQKISKQLDIEGILNQEINSLSRGQRQRVAIAQSIIHYPKLLLLDEPASGLDPEARMHLSKLLLQLREQGITIIVSSHILSELEDYCTHMLVLRDGKLIQHSEVDPNNPDSLSELYMKSSPNI